MDGVLHGHLVDAGPCPYLPDRRFLAFQVTGRPEAYRVLMDHRFRRTGAVMYRPMCEDCTACQPIRMEVAKVVHRRDQRRIWRRNQDLTVTWVDHQEDAERIELYRRYQQVVHAEADPHQPTHLLLEDGGVPGGQLIARDPTGRLVAVSVCDRIGDALSSVYGFYAPNLRDRALGVFMALAEIAYAKTTGLTWWYPGFPVPGCRKMEYKARYPPAERLTPEGRWAPVLPPEPLDEHRPVT